MKSVIRIILSILIFFTGTYSFAQFDTKQGQIIADNNPGGIIEAYELEKSDVAEGSFFMNDYWLIGAALLYDGRVFSGSPLKYNLRDDYLVVLDDHEVSRALRFDKIKNFEWFDVDTKKNAFFVNCMEFNSDDAPLTGFAEVLVEGEIDLLLHRKLILVKGNYSITHDAGQLNDEYNIEELFYLNIEDKLVLAQKKKTILPLFEDKRTDVEKYVKGNYLRYNNREDLIKIITYYNTL